VTGVWFGNDDYSDLASGTTGGHMAAPVWHQYMTAAHTSMDIPQIPGLALHPRQIEERQRLAEIQREDPTAGSGATEPSKRMPAGTRKMLTSLAKLLKEAPKLKSAGGVQEKGASLDRPPIRTQ
ncbi:MAG: penicillin-binding protein, partial [Rhodomicrobium sp.]